MTIEDVIKEELSFLIEDIIKKYDEKGMRASGNFADSLRVEVSKVDVGLSKVNGKIFGADYVTKLEVGQKPSGLRFGSQAEKDAISKLRKESIDQWLIDKKLDIPSFLVARKIIRYGWKRERFKGVNLISEVITPSRIKSITDRVGMQYAVVFAQLTIKIFTDAFNK